MNRLPPEPDGCFPVVPRSPEDPSDAAAARMRRKPSPGSEVPSLLDLSEPEREELARAYPAW